MSGQPEDALYAEMWRLYEEWFSAIPGDDRSFFERVLADDWHYTNYYGEVRGKAEYLELIAPIAAGSPANRMVELVARPNDPVVLVHGLYVIPEPFAPAGGSSQRFTAVWIRREGGWKALAHHATTVAT